jgi:hypothetical protein
MVVFGVSGVSGGLTFGDGVSGLFGGSVGAGVSGLFGGSVDANGLS